LSDNSLRETVQKILIIFVVPLKAHRGKFPRKTGEQNMEKKRKKEEIEKIYT